MKPEEQARQDIDNLLIKAGWIIQDVQKVNMRVGLGIAVREFQTKAGPVDYALFVDRKAVAVIEAKPAGTTLSGVSEQSGRYSKKFPENVLHFILPFGLS